MKNAFKVVVLGSPKVGKTTLIEEAIYGNQHRLNQPYEPTIEDIYCAIVECEKNLIEKLFIHDYSGKVSSNPEAIKMYLSFCDAFLIIFSITDKDSFQNAIQIKKIIEKFKDKKDIPIVMVANKIDKIKEATMNLDDVRKWIAMEPKIKLMEVTATDRKSITECLLHLASKLITVSKSSFSRKTKSGSIQLEL